MKNTKPNELTGTPPVGFSELLGERLTRVIQLREHQDKTFKEIGQAIGCCSGRAQQLYHHAKRKQEYHAKGDNQLYYGLTVRAANCLYNANITEKSQVAQFVAEGRLKKIRNCGLKSQIEICKWAGVPPPAKPTPRIHVPKLCPHCGGKLA